MGKKGSWFSAIKKVFLLHTKDKSANESDRKTTKEKKKKKGLGKLRHSDTNSFIPLFREPSSIEKILDEAEREHKLIFRPPTPPNEPRSPPLVPTAVSPRIPSKRVTSPRVASPRVSPPRASSPRVTSSPPRVASPPVPPPENLPSRKEIYHRPEPTLSARHASATKIQAAYRGYTARKSFRSLKGLVRLQGVVRGQSVKRQTTNAMKQMQQLVRVQSHIRSQRIKMLENQARSHAQYRNDKDVESTLGKWSLLSEAGNYDDWDDSLLTKEEIEARLQRKVDAAIKRERAMAYAYSHQLWKSTAKSPQSSLADIQSNGFPWWWNWLERQLPLSSTPENKSVKSFHLTPPRPHSELKPSPRTSSSNHKQHHFAFDGMDTPTPRSSRSVAFLPTRQARTPMNRTPQPHNSTLSKYSRARGSRGESPFDLPAKDDDSLMSCPVFSGPSYMNPTASARAKIRATSTPGSEKRRLSFPLTQGIDSKGSNSQKDLLDKHQPLHTIGNLSVDSTVSMPATIGRKPFNRFV